MRSKMVKTRIRYEIQDLHFWLLLRQVDHAYLPLLAAAHPPRASGSTNRMSLLWHMFA